MVKTMLVNVDLEMGLQVVRALETGNLKIDAPLWLYAPRAAYRYLNELLIAAGARPEESAPIVILPMTHPFVQGLRRRFVKTRSVEGMRAAVFLIALPHPRQCSS